MPEARDAWLEEFSQAVAPGETTLRLQGLVGSGARWPMLRVVTPVDEQLLHVLEASGHHAWSYRHRGTSIPAASFSQSLWTGVTTQLVVADPQQPERLLGSLCFFGYDARNAYGHVAVCFTATASTLVWPLRGVFLFLEHVFTVFPVRFLLAEVVGFNLETFDSAIPAQLIEVCGTIRDCEYHDGRFWPKYLLCVNRTAWDEYRDELVRLTTSADSIADLAAICGRSIGCLLDGSGAWLDTPIGELGLDSLGLVELSTALDRDVEELYGFTLRELV